MIFGSPDSGEFADPEKVHEVNHEGKWFKVRGPLTVPRTPQGRPTLLQAGSSGRGRVFASEWADVIFTADPGLPVAQQHYREQKEQIAAAGRNPDDVKLLPMAYAVVGETQAIAEEKDGCSSTPMCTPSRPSRCSPRCSTTTSRNTTSMT